MNDSAGGVLISLIIIVVFLAIYFIPLVKILHKAGYSGWWSVLIIVPIVNLIMLYVFAFADWPALRGNARQ
jgi:uncharacterized membrane protein YhaH (DUF805 family)